MDCDVCHNLLSNHITCDDIEMGFIISEKLYNNKIQQIELSYLELEISFLNE